MRAQAIAEKHGITTSAVESYFRDLKEGPNVFEKLLKADYKPEVVLLWVHRPASEGKRSTSARADELILIPFINSKPVTDFK